MTKEEIEQIKQLADNTITLDMFDKWIQYLNNLPPEKREEVKTLLREAYEEVVTFLEENDL